MTTATPTQGAITRKEFHASKEFLALTDKQRVWVDAFVDSQDAGQATRTAYGDQTDSAYRAMLTRKVETSPRVLAALDLFYGRSPKEKFLRDLQLDIKRAKGVAKIEARRLFAKIAGLDGSPDSAVPVPPVLRSRVPAGATALADENGVVRGYRTADGEYVRLAEVVVER
jgi:hypothetical protein